MPRPKRCRRICKAPPFCEFSAKNADGKESVTLSVDEFEAIRLIDYRKLTHEQCARQMNIARTTVTAIYESARYKLADSLLHGKRLLISGGNYCLCDGTAAECCEYHCHHYHPKQRKEGIMRIAIPYENEMIFQHFGHSKKFKLYDVADGAITAQQVVDTAGNGHSALAGFLTQNHVDIVICGGIGGGAQAALAQAGIQLYGGVSGGADQAVCALLNHTLTYNPDVRCSHHGHDNNTCGNHGCGNHSCH